LVAQADTEAGGEVRRCLRQHRPEELARHHDQHRGDLRERLREAGGRREVGGQLEAGQEGAILAIPRQRGHVLRVVSP
jgi:hypothetical protein